MADEEVGAQAPPDAGPTTRSGWWRAPLAALLVLVGAVLAPVAVVARWADDQVGDTDRYVETVRPLASDPDVQDAVIDRITREVMLRLDIEGVTDTALEELSRRGLPPRAEGALEALVVPLERQVHDLVDEQVGRLIRSDTFEQAWVEANRQAHTQLVATLTGKGSDVVDTRSGVVSVNLAAVIATVKERLVERGFELAGRIPEVDAEFAIIDSPDLERAQTGFRLLGAISTVLPWLSLVLLGAGVVVARGRRRTAVVAALAVAASMVVLGLTLNLVRLIYLDAVPADRLPPAAAAAVFDAVVRFIRTSLRAVLVVFLATAVIVWLTGPDRGPTAVRDGLTRATARLRRLVAGTGVGTGPVGATLHAYRGPVRVGVLGAALLAVVMADHPSGRYTLVVLGVALVVLLVAEVLATPPRSDVPRA